jgi:hypothetical protein
MSSRPIIRRSILVVLCSLLIVPGTAVAEEPPALELGARVCVFLTEPAQRAAKVKKIGGQLLGMDEATISVGKALTGQLVVIPRQNISSLDFKIRKGQRGRGAKKGMVIGAVIGLVVGFAQGDGDAGSYGPHTAGQKAGIGALTLGSVGALVGAVKSPGEQWQSLPPERIHLSLNSCKGSEERLLLAVKVCSW